MNVNKLILEYADGKLSTYEFRRILFNVGYDTNIVDILVNRAIKAKDAKRLIPILLDPSSVEGWESISSSSEEG